MVAPAVSRGTKPKLEVVPPAPASSLEQLPLELVDVGENVRVDPGELEDLVGSIRELGVLQPVRAIGPNAAGRYRLVWGQRRYLACLELGMATIPAIVEPSADVDKPGALRSIEQLTENLQRKDLNPIEEAIALRAILDADPELTQEALAARLARSRPWVSNTLRLLAVDERVQELVRAETISASHARAIATLPERQQRELADRVVTSKLSSHDLEREIKWKEDAAQQEVNKAAKTQRTIPKVVAALEKAEASKTAPVLIHGPWDVDVSAVVKAVKAAGWKRAESKYAYGGRPEACDCEATGVEISGRSPSVKPICVDDKHQAKGRDADWAARQEAERVATELAGRLTEAVRVDLGIARSRPLILALIGWGLETWHDEDWATHAAHSVDEQLDNIAKLITARHRLRDVPVQALLDELLKAQGTYSGDGPAAAERVEELVGARSAKGRKAAAG